MFRDSCALNVSSWASLIYREISISSALACSLSSQPSRLGADFYKSLRLPEKDFRKLAMPGDLILFAGRTVMNKVQRLVTQSRFDHVALLTRDRCGRLQVLEATGTDVLFP